MIDDNGRCSRDPVPVFLRETIISSCSFDRDAHSLMWSVRRFLCQAKCPEGMFLGGFLMAHDLPEPCEYQSLDGCQKRFLAGPQRS